LATRLVNLIIVSAVNIIFTVYFIPGRPVVSGQDVRERAVSPGGILQGRHFRGGINPLECRRDYTATSNNMKLVQWPLMGGLFHLAQRGGPPRPFLSVPNATAHPSTASVPITVLLYNGRS